MFSRLLITLVVLLVALAPCVYAASPDASPPLRDFGGRDNFLIMNKEVLQFDRAPAVSKLWSPEGDTGFSISNKTEGEGACLFAHNGGNAPVSALIQLIDQDNLSTDHEFPLSVVIPPKTDQCVAKLSPRNKKLQYNFRYNYAWIYGDYRAEHAARGGYRLPVAGARTALPPSVPYPNVNPFTVNAIDFVVDSGAPILAMRSGVVFAVKDGVDDKKPSASGQQVSTVDVLHDDGTIASYIAVADKSAVVKVGQLVAAGDKLASARAGTGYGPPRFAFVVWKPGLTENGFERISLPAEFCLNDKCRRLAGQVDLGKDTALTQAGPLVADPRYPFENDGPVARIKLKRTALELLAAEKYDQLESLAKELRRTQARFRDGGWKIHAFFEGIAAPERESREAWAALVQRLVSWRKANPDSLTSLTALTSALNNVCWYASGAGYDSISRAEYRELYGLRQAAILEFEKVKVGPADDCPERYLLLLVLAKNDGLDRAAFEKRYKTAVAFEPRYYDYQLAKAEYLAEDMFGANGPARRFIDQVATKDAGKEGKAIVMRVLAANYRTLAKLTFKKGGFTWPQVKESYAQIEKLYPGSVWNLNLYARLACIAGDKPTARKLFAKIGDQPYLEAWEGSTPFFEKWKQWSK
ncbi:M23 family metallopeptidase [Geomesophilobacter sediminis]|uniref:Peptidoglycan DD-metalloendopeptidase family protein n=1 Tax=Geomesophilobacter sediminis TaxID=2798584 RepID=A0A8J7JBP5_9BACT|nr:M23 family metallopeptidase [Geomesophilobacter sediminis]MBJ6724611.1 peptidoglycan DD-metalloendopeptidase family protein [Geomesophilobacter sediminis]